MERSLTIPIGIIMARTPHRSQWQDHYAWQFAGVVQGRPGLEPGSLMRQEGETSYFFAGQNELILHATDIESYELNLSQVPPRLYVVLKPQDDAGVPTIHLLTAAPDEAEAYLEGDDCLVDGVPMPAALIELLAAFVAGHARGETADAEKPLAAKAAKQGTHA
jgi:hypothetical protein